jgi:hypothetical protein
VTAEWFSVCTVEPEMDAERFQSAYRLGIGIVLVYVLWLLVPEVRGYTNLVVSTARQSRTAAAAQRPRLSAANLESALQREPAFGPNSQLHCEPAAREWDYVCNYLPTPLQSRTRLQFGVSVDAVRWVKVSRVVPMGTILPPSH